MTSVEIKTGLYSLHGDTLGGMAPRVSPWSEYSPDLISADVTASLDPCLGGLDSRSEELTRYPLENDRLAKRRRGEAEQGPDYAERLSLPSLPNSYGMSEAGARQVPLRPGVEVSLRATALHPPRADRGVALSCAVLHRVLNNHGGLDHNEGLCPTLLGSKALRYVAQCLAAKQSGAQALIVVEAAVVVQHTVEDCARQGYTPIDVVDGSAVALSDTSTPGLRGNLLAIQSDIPFSVKANPGMKAMRVARINTPLRYSPLLRLARRSFSSGYRANFSLRPSKPPT